MIDNLPAHKAAGVREAIEARGAVCDLRQYHRMWSVALTSVHRPLVFVVFQCACKQYEPMSGIANLIG
jgi:hypothetical protein